MPAAGLTLHPQPCQLSDPSDPARVRALLLPADPRRPGQIIPVKLSSSAISDVIGGGLLHEVDCTDTSMPMHVVYQDADRDTKELLRACGYFRLPAHLSDQCRNEEAAALQMQISVHAARVGLHVAGVFHEAGRSHDHAFYALLDEVRRCHAVAVIVPGLAHLTQVPALSGADRLTLVRYLRAAIVVLPASAS